MAAVADRAPIPPGATPLPDDQGLPPRPILYQPVAGEVAFRRGKIGDQDVIVLVYDSPDTRTVSYWTEDSFVTLAERMLAFVGKPQLTVADLDDLKSLNDPSQIVEP